MKDWAEFLRAISALLWPTLGFVALFVLKAELKDLLNRVRKGKVLGQEIELSESLEKLSASAEKTASEVAALPPAPPAALPAADSLTADSALEREVLGELGRSPKAALMLLASGMEREVRQLLASMGRLDPRRPLSFPQAIQVLDESGGLLRHVAGSVDQFWSVRNRLVHGRSASDEDIIRAIDSGLVILRTIKGIPHEQNVVHHPGVEVFSDREGKTLRAGVRAIVLETTSPGGAKTTRRVYPTTRTHFEKGMRVAWDWSFDLGWGESWYRDPHSGLIEYGWTSSAEFIGRDLNDI